MGMDQYLLIPFLVGWTSIYQLFWCSPGVQGFDTLPYVPTKNWKWMPATDPDLFGCVVWDSPWWKGLEWQNSRKLSTMKNDEKHSAGCIPWSHWTRFNQQSQDGKSHTLQAATVQHCGLCTFKLWTVNRKRDFPGGYCNYSSGQATKKSHLSYCTRSSANSGQIGTNALCLLCFHMMGHMSKYVKYHKIPWNLPWKTWKRIVLGFLTLSPVHALSAVQDTVGSSLGQPIGSTWPQIADGPFTARNVAMM